MSPTLSFTLHSLWIFYFAVVVVLNVVIVVGSILILCIKRYYYFFRVFRYYQRHCSTHLSHNSLYLTMSLRIVCFCVIFIELLFTKLKYSWVMVMMRIKKWMTHGNETRTQRKTDERNDKHTQIQRKRICFDGNRFYTYTQFQNVS